MNISRDTVSIGMVVAAGLIAIRNTLGTLLANRRMRKDPNAKSFSMIPLWSVILLSASRGSSHAVPNWALILVALSDLSVWVFLHMMFSWDFRKGSVMSKKNKRH